MLEPNASFVSTGSFSHVVSPAYRIGHPAVSRELFHFQKLDASLASIFSFAY